MTLEKGYKNCYLDGNKHHAMFNIDISSSFNGVFPPSIPIPAHRFSSAVTFYKSAFQVTSTVSSQPGKTTLLSRHGFRFDIHAISSAVHTRTSLRLQLPRNVDRRNIARTLASRDTGAVRTSKAGLRVKDPYGITWTIA